MPGQQQDIMNVLFEARRMRRTSNTSIYSAPKIEQVKKMSSKEQLLVEPPKHAKRVTFDKKREHIKPRHTTVKESEMQTGLTSCLITNPSCDPRVTGGANNPAERKVGWLARTDSECQFKAPGLDFLTERETDVTTFEVKIRESLPIIKDYTNKCDFFPKYVDERRYKDQTTQTLYRESSAQTVAYLPDIMDKEDGETLEVFNLSRLLPGDKPPGLYEVEVLERARKRWAFNKALRTNFRKQLNNEREKAIKSKYRPILEAFEWEHWMEREEYIQECQMMRLEIVIRMFDKREKQMHEASKSRIEKACEYIEEKRQRGLNKNELEYQRAFRRLQIKNAGISRRWVKQSPMYALGTPCSEFYGPLIRHGVDPARRHFVGDGRKAFDMRIDDLEKRVNMNQLQCRFTKLKEWSKPKEYVKEYEQNFCSDKHLQKLYESLKTLRSQATKQKTTPKCLIRRPKSPSNEFRPSFNYKEVDLREFFAPRRADEDESKVELTQEQVLAIQQHLQTEKRMRRRPDLAKEMLKERRSEDLEHLLQMYEGSTIGWIMQFLSEEMERLKEQRKLHFFSILTQKERWRREAAEAGLRQKENNMRAIYEDLYQSTNAAHSEVTDDYINTILTTDVAHIAECEAAESVVNIAKQIDKDIQRWLDSFKLIQTPLTYVPLRVMLGKMVFPEMSELLEKYEKSLIAKYIVEDVIFAGIWEKLENYDIAFTIASDLIDRLIDNDLYLFSTESESESPKRNEVEAIIRKLIRQAVPGRRWKTETERIIHENYVSLLDDVFDAIIAKYNADPPPIEPIDLRKDRSTDHVLRIDDIHKFNVPFVDSRVSGNMDSQVLLTTQTLTLIKKMKEDKITKELTRATPEVKEDPNEDQQEDPLDKLINTEFFEQMTQAHRLSDETQMYQILSTMDIVNEEDFRVFRKIPSRAPSATVDSMETQTQQVDQLIGALQEFVAGYDVTVEEENTEYEADDEGSWWNDASGEDVVGSAGDMGGTEDMEGEHNEFITFSNADGIDFESSNDYEKSKDDDSVKNIKIPGDMPSKVSLASMQNMGAIDDTDYEDVISEAKDSDIKDAETVLVNLPAIQAHESFLTTREEAESIFQGRLGADRQTVQITDRVSKMSIQSKDAL
ncbi:cilia- and flagella-associated protein 91 isoform X2 [Drosophila mojavensis]|uniref:cilia- and flagella-associated protein 91 isoform X2 n=1 Tax=Drosophila mojavensis TaxID=7230 RepID=UPI001CD16521|nr:cilia- and flagella-associated protein 91 isoform X2 [Drosophila mojavensis]